MKNAFQSNERKKSFFFLVFKIIKVIDQKSFSGNQFFFSFLIKSGKIADCQSILIVLNPSGTKTSIMHDGEKKKYNSIRMGFFASIRGVLIWKYVHTNGKMSWGHSFYLWENIKFVNALVHCKCNVFFVAYFMITFNRFYFSILVLFAKNASLNKNRDAKHKNQKVERPKKNRKPQFRFKLSLSVYSGQKYESAYCLGCIACFAVFACHFPNRKLAFCI